jgi:hypothetical protein
MGLRIVYILIFFLLTTTSSAQKVESYTTSNGLLIKPGDTLVLGVGSAPDGFFNYIYSGVAMTIFSSLAEENEVDFRLPDYFNGAPVEITRIRKKDDLILLYFNTDGWGTFIVDIEEAIKVCEVAWCRPEGYLSQQEYEKLVLLYRAVKDGSITVKRFEQLRSEMLE